jgi:PTS system N-acetylglucosamine-specific IIC component
MSSSTADAGGLPAAPATSSPIMSFLQRLGRSLMLPIAVLPAAGVLLRLGQADLLGADGLGWEATAAVVGSAGNALFTFLPLLFAVGVAIGFARRADGTTGLAAVVGWLSFHFVSMNMFVHSDLKAQVVTKEVNPDAPGGVAEVVNYGLQNPTRVFGGIVMGLVAAGLWQRYRRTKLPTWLAFFGGRRLVPILTSFAGLILGVIFGWVWPVFGRGLTAFGEWLARNEAIGSGIYGAINRLLIPFGLHHIPNTVVWQQIPECNVGGKVFAGDLNCYLQGAPGAGTFMAGFYPVIMFGLPAAAIAMWRAAPKERRSAVGGLMLAGALTAFVTGITEPIEFAFIFIAPLLFAVHIVLTGISMAVTTLIGGKLGFSFSSSLIDMILFGTKSNTENLIGIIILGLVYAVVYYFVFSFAIRRFNLATPGREPEGDVAMDAEQAAAVKTGASAPARDTSKPSSAGGEGDDSASSTDKSEK